jgi:hypothetical protein
MSMSKDKEVEELRREVAELKAALKPGLPAGEREVAEWRDRMHQMRERQMSRAGGFSPADLRAMEEAAPASTVRDLVAHGTRPSRVTDVPSGPKGGSGWVEPAPIRPPAGIRYADRLMDKQDERDRADLIERERKGR